MARSNRFVRFGYRRPPPWTKSLQSSKSSIYVGNDAKVLREDVTNWPTLNSEHVALTPISVPQDATVPSLSHGVDVVLRGDGLYPLEAPWSQTNRRAHEEHRSRNFYSDSLRVIVPPERIAWHRMPAYVPAASDGVLHDLARKTHGVRFCSSTSSITPALSAFYHLLSNFRDTDLSGGLSAHVRDLPVNFARMHRKPTALILERVAPGDDTFSVNNHTGPDSGPSILRELGHSMERMLTMPPREFADKFVMRGEAGDAGGDGSAENFEAAPPRAAGSEFGPCGESDRQFYHYSRASKFLLRAQIDCRDERTGEVFDVKTRAVAPIRYDLDNYAMFTAHRLRYLNGKFDSYEREFYDMVRSVFLKYALQLRIGRMSGALVAYHNTAEVLGLEYIRLSEIESYVFGSSRWGDIAFSATVRLLEKVLACVTEAMELGAGERAKVVLHTEWSQLKMYIFVQRLRDGERDPFGADEFIKCDRAAWAIADDAAAGAAAGGAAGARKQWHLDSFIHGNGQGFSMVGGHAGIGELGGSEVTDEEDESGRRRRSGAAAAAMDRRNFDCSLLEDRERFRVWELNVAPIVNGGVAVRTKIAIGRNDRFALKFELGEVRELRNEHVCKFVTDLGVIYLR